MNKTTKYAQIPVIDRGIAFSDPAYDHAVWCQYRKEFHDTDWLMKLETNRDKYNYVNMTLTVGRRTLMSGLTCQATNLEAGEFQLAYPSRFVPEQVELGIDTARIFIGALPNPSELNCIYTGADGLFGNLVVFTCKGEDKPAGFFLSASVDGNLTQEEELFQTLIASFNGREINQTIYDSRISQSDLSLRVLTAAELRHSEKANDESSHDKNLSDR